MKHIDHICTNVSRKPYTKYILHLFTSIVLLISSSIVGNTQTVFYGNDWVQQGQHHLKLKVAQTGLYRIYKSDLTAAGVPVDIINGNNFFLYKNGKKEPVYVSTQGLLSDEDFIEFIGEINTGEVDAGLYEDGEEGRLNPYYSLFTDSTTYFLSWTDAVDSPQYTTKANPQSGAFQRKESFRHTSLVTSTNNFVRALHRGYEVSHFNKHSGTASGLVAGLNYTLPGTARVADGTEAEVTVRIMSGVRNVTVPQKILKISFNGKEYINENIQHSKMYEYTFTVPAEEVITGNNRVRIEGLGGSSDRFHGVFGKMTYNRTYNFNNGQVTTWDETGLIIENELPLTGFTGEDRIVVYDRTNQLRSVVEKTGNLFLFQPEVEGDASFIAIGENSILKPTILNTTTMPWVVDENTDYIIVSHPKFITESPQALSEYAH